MWAIFEFQTTLNYGPHFWKLQKCREVSKTLGNAIENARPSMGSRELICKCNKSPNMSLEPTLKQLKAKQMGSNTNANLDHHMKSHDQAPCEVTSPTNKAKLHDIL